MLHWNPVLNDFEEYTPEQWPASFSEKDKIQFVNLFFFLKNKKGFIDSVANSVAEMYIFKQKYRGLTYSESQEKLLHKLFTR
jgi:hypothetical protein